MLSAAPDIPDLSPALLDLTDYVFQRGDQKARSTSMNDPRSQSPRNASAIARSGATNENVPGNRPSRPPEKPAVGVSVRCLGCHLCAGTSPFTGLTNGRGCVEAPVLRVRPTMRREGCSVL